MLDAKSGEIYNIDKNQDREKRLWDECHFVFDSSALLNFYFYSPSGVHLIFNKIFTKLKFTSNLWIPKRVKYEYLRNREKVINQILGKYNDLIDIDESDKSNISIKKISNFINTIISSLQNISKQLEGLKEKNTKEDQHPYFKSELLKTKFESLTNQLKEITSDLNDNKLKVFNSALEELKKHITLEISNRENEIKLSLNSVNDKVLEGFSRFLDEGEGLPFDEEIKIPQEGEMRYLSKTPPGYKDNKKDGIDKYGDLIVWKEIIAYSRRVNKPIILITDEKKTDWWSQDKKPHDGLIYEFHRKTNQQFWMYSLKDFIYKANKLLEVNLDEQTLTDIEQAETLDYVQQDSFEWTVSSRVTALGYNATPIQLSVIGKMAAMSYRNLYKLDPMKRQECINDKIITVYSYVQKDLPILDNAIISHLEPTLPLY